MENPSHYRFPLAWYKPRLGDDTVSKTSSGLDMFSTRHSRKHYKPQGGPNDNGWIYDQTLKASPRRTEHFPPANTKTSGWLKRLLRIPYAIAWIFGIVAFTLAISICFALIGILPPSLFLADSPHDLASKLCTLPVVQMLPLCSSVARENIRSDTSSDEPSWPFIRWKVTSDSPTDFSKSKLYKDITSTQAFFREKLLDSGAAEPMTMALRLNLHLAKESKTHIAASNIPSQYGILEAYTGLTAELDRSINCLQKFSSELNSVFDSLGTGLPYLSRELAKLESHSKRRSFLTRPFFRASDKARMIRLYTSRMKIFDNQTTELLLKGQACFLQLPSLEDDWQLINNLNANSSQSLRNTLNSLRGPFSDFLPSWMTSSSQTREFYGMLEVLNTLYVLHIKMWPEVKSVTHDLEEIENEISDLQQQLTVDTFGSNGNPWGADPITPQTYLHLALLAARGAELEMRERGLRDRALLDRLWKDPARGRRELLDPLWMVGVWQI